MKIATDAPARKQNLSGTVILPREIAELPYFANEKRVFSRQDALAWIATHVRHYDNCTLKRWQESWSLRYLAEAWGWSVKKVRCFLEKLENWGIIRTTLGKVKGTAQIVITYMVQRLDWSSFSEGAQQGHSKGTAGAQSKERHKGKEEDSCSSQAPNANEFWPEQDDQPVQEMAGADPSPEPAGAGPSEAPGADPSPQAERADLPKNSAQKGSAARKRRVPDDWRPKDATVAWARNGKIGAADPQIEEQLDAFRDHHIAKGSTFADLDRAFQTWMRNAKRYGHLDGPKKTYAQQNREAEFSI